MLTALSLPGRWRPRRRYVPVHARPTSGARRLQLAARRAAAVFRETALWLLAAAGISILVGTIALDVAGYRPVVVRSGSMEPTIPLGAMVVVHRVPAAALRVDDVITVPMPGGTGKVTHRIVSIESDGGAVTVHTKGDANDDPDPAPVTLTSAPRVAYNIPVLGTAGGQLATPAGGFGLGVALTALLLFGRRRER